MKVEKLSFLLPNASTFGKAKGTNKREKYQIYLSISEREYLKPKVKGTKNSIKREKRKYIFFSERENFMQ